MPSAVPSALGLACAHDGMFERAVLANANRGGENVHSGCVIGAALGAQSGMSALPERLIEGLHHSIELRREIDAFVAAVTNGHAPVAD